MWYILKKEGVLTVVDEENLAAHIEDGWCEIMWAHYEEHARTYANQKKEKIAEEYEDEGRPVYVKRIDIVKKDIEVERFLEKNKEAVQNIGECPVDSDQRLYSCRDVDVGCPGDGRVRYKRGF